MSRVTEPSLSESATTAATPIPHRSDVMPGGPRDETARLLPADDLGPPVCPTCGSLQLDALDPLRALSGVLLSLLSSLLGVVALSALVAGLLVSIDQAPGLLLLSVGSGLMSVLAGFSAHRTARRPASRQIVCRVCGEREGRWTATSSRAAGVLAILLSGPLLLPGLLLLAAAFATFETVSPRMTLGLAAAGLGLIVVTLLLVRRRWLSSHGTDWATQ